MSRKTNKKMLRRVLSLILIITMTVTGMNLEMVPGSIYAAQKTEKKEGREEKARVVKELVDERTENTNTYLLSDGAKQLEIFPENIRYESDGKLVEYDASLSEIDRKEKRQLKEKADKEPGDYKAVNGRGDSKQYFPETMNENNGIVMMKEEYMIEMSPVLSEKEEYSLTVNDVNAVYRAEKSTAEYQYESMETGVKENIILNAKPAGNTFSYKINTENVILKQRKNDKGIQILDKRNKEVVAYISAPNIIDADGNIDYENVSYTLGQDSGNTVLTLTVADTYFEDENLKYPVTIDPTMVWMGDYLTAVGVWSASFMADSTITNSQLTVSNHLMESYPYDSVNRVYIDTGNMLTTQAFVGSGNSITDKYIESAHLSIHETQKPAHYPTGTVRVNRVLNEWDASSVTWNTQPNISEDYIAEIQSTGIEGEWHYLDITGWVQDIASGKEENNGLVLTCPQRGMAATIYGPQIHYISDGDGHTVDSRHMTIFVVYRDIEKYDASIEMNAEYNSDDKTFDIKVEDTNEMKEDVSIAGYKIYGRKNDESRFSVLYTGEDISETAGLSDIKDEKIDFRACILYSDGTVRPSNIVSYGKKEDTVQDEGNDITTVTYEQTAFDTDGDGLEDGYEIWDFKSYWNKQTEDSTEESPVYELDTDGDGLPDGYEVFTLGTDPAAANEANEDSDGDGWSDLKEYEEGTDPWLEDSDFDGINDKSDSRPRETNKRISQVEIANINIHKRLYNIETKEIENNVLVTYMCNIYNGQIYQKYWDYSDTGFNKYIKYFYDDKGNCTAIVESYDKEYDAEGKKAIGVTYSYNEEGNITLLCDQSTRYMCEYKNGELSNLKIGNKEIVSYKQECLVDNLKVDEEGINLSIGDVITENIYTSFYGNSQKIIKKTTVYKTEETNKAQVAQMDKIYYNNSNEESYILKYNNEGKILEISDYTCNDEEDNSKSSPIKYTYTYDENKTKIVRSDNFIKEEERLEEEHSTSIITKYQSKDLQNNSEEHISSRKNVSIDEKNTSICTLYNNDELRVEKTISNDNKDIIENVMFSQIYNKNIFRVVEREEEERQTRYTIEVYGQTKCFIYKYDGDERIVSISDDSGILYFYKYDAHGRLIAETDYLHHECHEYIYNNTGNIYANWKYPLDETGKIIDSQGVVKYYEYDDTEWGDQLTCYNGEKIVYDAAGNPIEYINAMKFAWGRGKNLDVVHKNEKEVARYKYNENGLRVSKVTDFIETKYTWDEKKLIRESVTYKKTGKKFDIWYFFNENDEIIGFEYSQINSMNGKIKKTRIYYEKNKLGDIIGLLDARGAEIVVYEYDAWGNIVYSICYEGYEEPYELNNIGYRGYYMDSETGFYYLNNRYYDSNIGRFINASGNLNIMGTTDLLGQNMYSYCFYKPSQYIISGDKNEILFGKKKYNGQEKDAYGYGGIVRPYDYVKDRYGGGISVYQAKTLTMRNFVMSDLEKNANNCSLVAITRVLNYYSLNGYKKIPSSNATLYKKVKSVGKKYGYTPSKGTGPTKINNIVNDVTKNYGYGKSKCHGIYIWTYDWQVKDEINKNKPVIMNIVGGYYGNHSVTICGYVVYKKKHKIGKLSYYSYYKMIEVYDGWSSTRHYIDYNAFAISQLGSFNTTTMKK